MDDVFVADGEVGVLQIGMATDRADPAA